MKAKIVPRTFDVLLIGGASGAGKSSLSYDFARYFGVALTEVDDFQIILKRLTTPEQLPAIHFGKTHADPHSLTPAEILANLIAIGEVMLPALVAVIENHIESQRPVVLEGDFILPRILLDPAIAPLAAAGRVRAAFVHEPEEAQLLANYLHREPVAGPQAFRAKVSALHSDYLAEEARRCGASVLLARPWDTALERLTALANQ